MLKQVQHDRLYNARHCKSKCAFTLAEVLITLVIIGVIAALTLPNLISKYQKQQTVVSLKKNYSILKNATQLSMRENGPISDWDYTLGYEDFAKKYYTPYLKVNKIVNTTSPTYKSLNGNGTYSNVPRIKLILDDGTIIVFYFINNTHYIIVDINGFKGPNRVGRDLFAFTLLNLHNQLATYVQYDYIAKDNSNQERNMEKALFFGCAFSANTMGGCHINAQGGWALGPGSYCSRKIELDGWQIKDDYPW